MTKNDKGSSVWGYIKDEIMGVKVNRRHHGNSYMIGKDCKAGMKDWK